MISRMITDCWSSQERCGDCLRDLGKCHNPSQNIGNADQEYHHAAHLCAFHHDVPRGFQCNVAVADAKDQGVDNGDGGSSVAVKMPAMIPPMTTMIRDRDGIARSVQTPRFFQSNLPGVPL